MNSTPEMLLYHRAITAAEYKWLCKSKDWPWTLRACLINKYRKENRR